MFAKPVYAAINIADPTLNPIARYGTVSQITDLVLPVLYVVAGFMFLTMLFWGSFTFLTSGGDAEKVAKSKKIITYTIVGLFIIICATLLVTGVANLAGIQGLPR
jgi:hypothetical protein